MNTKLEEAKKQAAVELGSHKFFQRNLHLWASDANQSVLAGLIAQKDLGPFDDPDSWEKAYQIGKDMLCQRPTTPEPQSAPSEWPHKFMRPIYTYADVRAYPAREFSALHNDYVWKNGEKVPSKKCEIFRAVVQRIIDEHNAKRGAQ